MKRVWRVRRWFQFHLRTIMLGMVLLSLVLGLIHRRQRLRAVAERHDEVRYRAEHFVVVCEGSYHRYRSSQHANDDPQVYVNVWRAVAEHHARLRDKRRNSVWMPWLSLAPDPPSPPVPDWPTVEH